MATIPAIQSETIWFNTLSAIAVALITALLDEPSFTELVGAGTVIAMNVANIILRRFTTKPLKGILKKPKKLNAIEHELRKDDIAIKEI